VLRSPGTCATVGLQGLENDVTVVDQGHLLLGHTLTGVIKGDADPHVFIPRLTELWRAGQFPFDRLIETFPFSRVNEELQMARKGEVVKPVLLTDAG
jgi:aryl-alcohol dehydrogenase